MQTRDLWNLPEGDRFEEVASQILLWWNDYFEPTLERTRIFSRSKDELSEYLQRHHLTSAEKRCLSHLFESAFGLETQNANEDVPVNDLRCLSYTESVNLLSPKALLLRLSLDWHETIKANDIGTPLWALHLELPALANERLPNDSYLADSSLEQLLFIRLIVLLLTRGYAGVWSNSAAEWTRYCLNTQKGFR